MSRLHLWADACIAIFCLAFSTCVSAVSAYTIIDLGTLGGTASRGYGINASGQVVGYSYLTGVSVTRAFLYDGGSMQDLSVLVDCVSAGWSYLESATAINDNGDITGYGYINGVTHAFLVSPVAIPIPAAAWLFGSGLLGLASLGRRRAGFVFRSIE